MRGIYSGAGIGAFLITTSLALAAPPKSLYVVSEMSRTPAKGKTTSTLSKAWLKDGKVRIDANGMVVLIDNKNQYRFKTNDKNKRMLVLPLNASERASTLQARLGVLFGRATHAKKIGTTSIGGHLTTIYDMAPGQKNESYKSYIMNDLGGPFPMKVEITGPMGSALSVTKSITVNPPLPDSLFTPPADYKRITIPTQPPMVFKGKPLPKPPKK